MYNWCTEYEACGERNENQGFWHTVLNKAWSCFQQNVSDSGPSPPTLQETLRRANKILWESSSFGLCRWLVPVIRVPGKLRRSLKKRIMKSMNHNINLIHKFWSLTDLCFNVLLIYPSQNRSKWKQNVCALSAPGRNVDEYGGLLSSSMFHKIPGHHIEHLQ